MGKIYKGFNHGPGPQSIKVIEENGREYPLPHIYRHSLDGFQWGYGGSGPADTALSILTDCLGEQGSKTDYQYFKWDFIASSGKELKITEEEIRAWHEKILKKEAKKE